MLDFFEQQKHRVTRQKCRVTIRTEFHDVLPGTPNNHLKMFGETTISYVKIGNHPIETTIYKWLALGFQVVFSAKTWCNFINGGIFVRVCGGTFVNFCDLQDLT